MKSRVCDLLGIQYPVITKAVDSFVENWKDCMIICQSEAELKAAYETLSCPRVLEMLVAGTTSRPQVE